MKHITLGLSLLLTISGWVQEKTPLSKKFVPANKTLETIAIYPAYERIQSTIPHSRFIEDIEFVPLETTDECLLKQDLQIVSVTQKEIIVYDYEKAYRFDRKGKFLNAIGQKGSGPGEYTSCLAVVADTLNQWLYFADNSQRIIKYDYAGKHVHTINLDFWCTDMLWIAPGELVLGNGSYYSQKAGERFSIYFYSEDKKQYTAKMACEKRDNVPLSISFPTMYKQDNTLWVKDFWSDTLYLAKDPLHLEARLLFDKGKFHFRQTDDTSMMTGEVDPRDQMVLDIYRVSAFDRFMFISTNKGVVLHDKKQRETIMSKYNPSSTFTDDLYGGPGISLGHNNGISQNKMYTYRHTHEFIEKSEGETRHTIGGKRYNDYQKMLKGLDPEGNQVVMIIHLKE